MVEWDDAAVVLRTVPCGDTSLLVYVLTQKYGLHKGIVRGGISRRQRATWQVGTILSARWKARLPDSLGTLTGEAVRYCAAPLMNSIVGLALLSSACTLCAESLAEKEAHPSLFVELIHFLSEVSIMLETPPIASYIRWECYLLRTLGYGLDLTQCAVTGRQNNLIYVSPRTGRAVSKEGAGEWKNRLLSLPSFLKNSSLGSEKEWQDGLYLTEYFLRRAVFATHHRPLPAARERLLGLINKEEENLREKS